MNFSVCTIWHKLIIWKISEIDIWTSNWLMWKWLLFVGHNVLSFQRILTILHSCYKHLSCRTTYVWKLYVNSIINLKATIYLNQWGTVSGRVFWTVRMPAIVWQYFMRIFMSVWIGLFQKIRWEMMYACSNFLFGIP